VEWALQLRRVSAVQCGTVGHNVEAETMKRIVMLLVAVAAIGAAPSHAGSWGVFGSYWDTKEADHGFGGGLRTSFGEALQFDLRGTYFNDLKRDAGVNDYKLHAAPFDAGLSFHFQNESAVEPYLGGGASYFLLDSNRGKIDDEVGYYALAGVEFGSNSPSGMRFFVEGQYRDVRGTIVDRDNSDLPDVTRRIRLQLRGLGATAGLLWHF